VPKNISSEPHPPFDKALLATFFVIPVVPLDDRSPAPDQVTGVRPRSITVQLTQGPVHMRWCTAIGRRKFWVQNHRKSWRGRDPALCIVAANMHMASPGSTDFGADLARSTIAHLMKSCHHRDPN
jgi:hypothetical protein